MINFKRKQVDVDILPLCLFMLKPALYRCSRQCSMRIWTDECAKISSYKLASILLQNYDNYTKIWGSHFGPPGGVTLDRGGSLWPWAKLTGGVSLAQGQSDRGVSLARGSVWPLTPEPK